jgi:hypothetical protein
MPTTVLAPLVALGVAVILAARVRIGFVVVVASMILVPAPLAVSNPFVPYATVTRILVVALGLRLLLGLRTGETSTGIWRWTPMHSAIVTFLACSYVAGVVWASTDAQGSRNVGAAVNLVDLFVFFAVMIATIRLIGDLRWVLGVVGAVLLASAAIGIVEHVTGSSWGHWLFRHAHLRTDAANGLEERVGEVRVRAGAEYALQYGWVLVMLLPALLAWLAGWRVPLRRWLPVGCAAVLVVLLAQYWSFSRSALAVLGGLVIVVAVAARDRRLLGLTAAGVVLGVVAFVSITSLQHGFVGVPSGYTSVRTARLPTILQLTADAGPLHGLGLGGLASLGFPSTDTTYLQLYGETGFLGLVSGVVLLVTGIACCVPGLRSRQRDDRYAAAAGLAAGVAMLLGGFAYDALRSLSSARPFLVLVAVGLVASERVTGPMPALARRSRRLVVGAVLGAAALGWVVFALAPVHYAQQFRFTTISAERETHLYDPVVPGHTFVNTVCVAASTLPADTPAAHLDCRDLQGGAGVGVLRIETSSPDSIKGVADAVRTQMSTIGLTAFTMSAETPVQRGRPTAAAWAPFWIPAATLLLLLFVPSARRRAPDAPQRDDREATAVALAVQPVG